MKTFKIDNKEHDLEKLSEECKAELALIQFVGQELFLVEVTAVALQAVKSSYLQVIKNSLLEVCGVDTLKMF